jgi:cytochrome P450
MATTVNEGTVQGFDEIPVFTYPENYYDILPSLLARLAVEHGPILKRRIPEVVRHLYGEWAVYLVGPEANRFVMHTDREVFSHELGWTPNLQPIMEKGLLNTDNPEHAWQRRMMNPAFGIAYMSRYLPIMARVIAERTRDWAERGEVDLYEESRRIAFDVAAEALVGFERGEQVDHMRDLFFGLLHGGADLQTQEEWYAYAMRVRAELDAMLLRLIAERRGQPTDDILGMLASAHDEDGRAFSDEELLGQVHILLVAGHETTTTMNAWNLYALAEHPDYLARVHAELDAVLLQGNGEITLNEIRVLKVLGYALDEAGRLWPPVAILPRVAVQEFEFGGYRVPAGITVRLAPAATHRLPAIFADPDRYDPDRFAPPREEAKRAPYALVTFGGGPRICIGVNFAQVEMKAAAAHILRRYTLEPMPEKPVVHRYYGVTAEVPSGIHVRVRPRLAR